MGLASTPREVPSNFSAVVEPTISTHQTDGNIADGLAVVSAQLKTVTIGKWRMADGISVSFITAAADYAETCLTVQTPDILAIVTDVGTYGCSECSLELKLTHSRNSSSGEAMTVGWHDRLQNRQQQAAAESVTPPHRCKMKLWREIFFQTAKRLETWKNSRKNI